MLMQARADTLFTYDEQGRMVCRNDLEGKPAPRLFLAYTSDGYVMRFGPGLPDRTAMRLQNTLGELPPVHDLRRTPAAVAAIEEVLKGPPTDGEGGPAYRFPEPLSPSIEAIQITDTNVDQARDTFPWLLTELAYWQPCVAVVRDGAAVSICFSARIGTAVCEAGVETLPAFRRRGFASAVTAAWAAEVRNSGRIPLYSTSWDNRASQRVAQRLELIMYGADVVWP